MKVDIVVWKDEIAILRRLAQERDDICRESGIPSEYEGIPILASVSRLSTWLRWSAITLLLGVSIAMKVDDDC